MIRKINFNNNAAMNFSIFINFSEPMFQYYHGITSNSQNLFHYLLKDNLHTTEIWNITEEIDLKNGTFMSNKRSIIFLQNTLRFPRQRNILVHFKRVFVNWTTYRKLNIRLVEYWMHEQSKIGYSTSHIRDMNKKKMFD